MKSSQDRHIAVIGLGKLGLPFAALWASKGYKVTGVDIDEEWVRAIQDGDVELVEPGFDAVFRRAESNFFASNDIAEAAKADVIFIFVGTPDLGEGKFTNEYIVNVCREIGGVVADAKSKKMVVLVSSVTPGSIEEEVIPALEEAIGGAVNEAFDFCYSPVFIALGSMMDDYVHPDIALIGESNSEAGNRLQLLLDGFYESDDVQFIRTNFINAELIKLLLSTFITTKISYGNMIAELCQKIPGADANEVVRAMGLDKRINPKGLKGAMPYGGPCFPRDNRALMYLTGRWKVDGRLVQATDGYNKALSSRVLDMVRGKLPMGGVVGVLGLAFKSGTDVTDESAAVLVADQLASEGYKVQRYDPAAGGDSESMEKAVQNADLVLVATPWDEFRELPVGYLKRGVYVVDMWGVVDLDTLPDSVIYTVFGKNSVVQPAVSTYVKT